MQRKWPLCTINLYERNPRICLEKCEIDDRGLRLWRTKPDHRKWLSDSKHPTRSHVFGIVAKHNGRWGASTRSFPQNNPITFPSILTCFIQIWTKTTHFFIQAVKPINILLGLLHTFRGILYLWPYFFLLITKLKELSNHHILHINKQGTYFQYCGRFNKLTNFILNELHWSYFFYLRWFLKISIVTSLKNHSIKFCDQRPKY